VQAALVVEAGKEPAPLQAHTSSATVGQTLAEE